MKQSLLYDFAFHSVSLIIRENKLYSMTLEYNVHECKRQRNKYYESIMNHGDSYTKVDQA